VARNSSRGIASGFYEQCMDIGDDKKHGYYAPCISGCPTNTTPQPDWTAAAPDLSKPSCYAPRPFRNCSDTFTALLAASDLYSGTFPPQMLHVPQESVEKSAREAGEPSTTTALSRLRTFSRNLALVTRQSCNHGSSL